MTVIGSNVDRTITVKKKGIGSNVDRAVTVKRTVIGSNVNRAVIVKRTLIGANVDLTINVKRTMVGSNLECTALSFNLKILHQNKQDANCIYKTDIHVYIYLLHFFKQYFTDFFHTIYRYD